MLREKAGFSSGNEHIVNDWENILPHYGTIECKLDPWVSHHCLEEGHVSLPIIVVVLLVLEAFHEMILVTRKLYLGISAMDKATIDVHQEKDLGI